MSFSQMTTAAFSSGRKNVEELLATARKIFWATAATSGSNQGRAGVARTIGLRPLPSEANSRPQSHISRSPAKHRRRHRRKRFLLIFYPFRSSRRFLLQSAVLRPLTVPLPTALISRYVEPIAGSSLAGGTSPAPSRYRPSSTRLGSSLTISGARQGRRWL
jgi:hypothetical protein